MRKGLFVVGVVVLIIGIALAAGSVYLNQVATTNNLSAGQYLSLTPSSIGSTTIYLNWNSAVAGATVYIATATPNCGAQTGVVTSGTGASGSLSAALTSGTTYYVFACASGSLTAVNTSYTSFGISILLLVGIIIAVIGVIILVLSFRKKAAPMPATMPAPTMSAPPAGTPPPAKP